MTATYTVPTSATDSYHHGHSHSPSHKHSHSRSQHRNSASSRLAPPFALPRIPSESIVQGIHQSHDGHDHELESFHTRNNHSFHANGLIPSPALDASGQQIIGKRKDSIKMTHPTAVTAYKPAPRNVSKPTAFLLQSTENYSLLHGILADDESRRIFYFMILNLCFMAVQSTYGYLTGSLGLISDSIHMFFDCVALLVGVCAAVMSKWPPSVKFPYGYGKIDTLAGLGNGIFLMLISIEIIYEAIERLFTGADLSRTTELLVVSSVGLLVNLVGIMAFHGHHGHDHGHGHSHTHRHTDEHDHAHDHDHSNHHHHHSSSPAHTPSKQLPEFMSASGSPKKSSKPASGAHHHGGENMEGIYLHIMADALGSVAVVVSTLLVQFTGWNGFDPLASCIIAILIFISTIPLVRSTTKILLLSLNSDVEYNLRDILAGVSAIRGVIGYTVPKFWLEDAKREAGDHHHHGHDHSHSHSHSHDHSHSHSHKHSHAHARKDSNESHDSQSCSDEQTVLGVIHIIASPTADLEDVKERVSAYLGARKMDIVVQVEREGEGRCWCGGGLKTG